MKPSETSFRQLSDQLTSLLNSDPAEAVIQARQIDLNTPDQANYILLKACTLVDGGADAGQKDAVLEGVALLRELHQDFPRSSIAYNLANGLAALVGSPPSDTTQWLMHQEDTRAHRAEARGYFWLAARDQTAQKSYRTQAWTNLANQFSNSFRLSEAHDARLEALEIDPCNGVAAYRAACDLLQLTDMADCSDLTAIEAVMLAKIAQRSLDRAVEFAGARAAEHINKLANQLPAPPSRSPHTAPFISWVESERLTLAPVVELVDPSLGKLDWLMLPGILERDMAAGGSPPPVFAMLNVLKSDFILGRDLAWRSMNERGWPTTGQFSDTLDYATYGPDVSALVLAHRTALDLLDKVGVTANHYFGLGVPLREVHFDKMWRQQKGDQRGRLTDKVKAAILNGTKALYGLVELADDYGSKMGILHSQKELRNAGTHRFVVLHDLGDPTRSRQAPEIERHHRTPFYQEVMRALRVARAAIQMLVLAIAQYEEHLHQQTSGFIASLPVPDHDWIRGRDEEE